MMERLINAVMDHFGITNEQVDKIKTIIDMVEFKKVNGKKIAYLTIGEGLEIKIVQSDEKRSGSRPKSRELEELDRIFADKGIFGSEN